MVRLVAIHLLNICVFLSCLAVELRAQAIQQQRSEYWHQWRGPDATGVSRTARPPIEWSESKNIRWKKEIDGNGSANPIVWQDGVFLLTAINTGEVDPSLPKPEDQPDRVFGITHPNTVHEFVVICLDRETGKEKWRQVPTRGIPHEGHHGDNDFASASPMTDGQRLYCWFGSAGMFCYDLRGNELWRRDLGKAYMGASLGEGCSPVVHNGKLVVVRDHQRQSTIHVLDAATGEDIWQRDRDEPNTWATPRIVEHEGRVQVITSGSTKIRSYDLDTGEIIWQCGGLTSNAIPCPVIDGSNVICMTGYKGYSALAIPLSAAGDISDSHEIVWSADKGTPYVPSPLLYDGLLFFNQQNQSILSCLDAKTGKTVVTRSRLNGIDNIYSSPVGADGRIYFTGRNGTTLVLKRSRVIEVLATNHLDERIDSSPALAGDQLFLRGAKYLYCIQQQ